MERIEADSIYEKASIYEKFQDLTQHVPIPFLVYFTNLLEKHLYGRMKVHFNVHIFQ